MSASSPTSGHLLFETAIGRCALRWNTRGVRAVALPDTDDAALRRTLTARLPETEPLPPLAPAPPAVADAVVRMVALLAGEAADLDPIPLDLTGLPAFDVEVYRLTRAIPPGQALTYGAIARDLGEVGLSRAVGAALCRNPVPIVVPCHRVLAADGSMHGFSAHGGVRTKQRMLAIEGGPGSELLTLF